MFSVTNISGSKNPADKDGVMTLSYQVKNVLYTIMSRLKQIQGHKPFQNPLAQT